MTATDWIEQARTLTDAELEEFRQRICVTGGHIGTANIGTCSRCGGHTSSGSMSVCENCAAELGVCAFDLRLTGWGSESAADPDGIAARWLALLMRGYSNERDAAKRALEGFELPGLAEAVGEVGDEALAGRAPTTAEIIVGFKREIPDFVEVGGSFLGAPVVKVQPGLNYALVRPLDTRDFEARARTDPRVAYLELNRQPAELED